MRKFALWGIAGCFLTLAMAAEPGAAAELSAGQIVEKNIAARGGLRAWRKIQSMVWVGHVERGLAAPSATASNLPFVLEMQRPNKTRFEIKAQNQSAVRIFDGSHGWKQRSGSGSKPELLPYTAEELRFAADAQGIDGPLIDYQAKGIAVALDGVDEVEGRKAYRLTVKLPSGSSHRLWIDAQTFLDVKYDRETRDALGRPGTISVFYRNYKTIEGLQIPLMIESRADAAKATDKMVIDRVVVNPPLPDMTFAKPNMPGRSNVVSVDREPPQAAQSARFRPLRAGAGFGEAR